MISIIYLRNGVAMKETYSMINVKDGGSSD